MAINAGGLDVNEGGLDRAIRIGAGVVLLLLPVIGSIGFSGQIVTGVIGVMLLATGIIGWCPMYTACHFTSVHKGT